MRDLEYTMPDKSPDDLGWILKQEFLEKIMKEINEVPYLAGSLCIEDIEMILLVANGEKNLLHQANLKK